MKQFKAPWGKSLWIISTLATAILLAAAVFPLQTFDWGRALVLALLAGAALFTVRGYSILSDTILIERLFWSTRLRLDGLQSVCFDPKAVRWSLRCGNGGLFSFTGWYWNKCLDAYRAFVTDPKRVVVLKFSKRTVVLSPESPEDFVRELSAHTNYDQPCERLCENAKMTYVENRFAMTYKSLSTTCERRFEFPHSLAMSRTRASGAVTPTSC